MGVVLCSWSDPEGFTSVHYFSLSMFMVRRSGTYGWATKIHCKYTEFAATSSSSAMVSRPISKLWLISDRCIQFCKVWTAVQSVLTIASFMSIHGKSDAYMQIFFVTPSHPFRNLSYRCTARSCFTQWREMGSSDIVAGRDSVRSEYSRSHGGSVDSHSS